MKSEKLEKGIHRMELLQSITEKQWLYPAYYQVSMHDFDFVDHNHPEQVDTQQVTIIIIHTILIPHTNKQQLRNDVETSLFKLLQTRDR